MKSIILTPLLRFLGSGNLLSSWDNEKLIREELFSIDRLEQHAKTLAIAQKVSSKSPKGQSLSKRLKDNGKVLLSGYQSIVKSVDEGSKITPAAEWLLDNYYIVEEQIREIYDDLPQSYYRQLPKLSEGYFTGYPRVFGIAWAFVAHTDSLFNPEMLRRFILAYQSVQPLTIGELWAIAITLRIVLVENLRRAAVQIMAGRNDRQKADDLANRLLSFNGQQPGASVDFISHDAILREYKAIPLPVAFSAQLIQRLRDQDPKVTPALIWLEEQFLDQETSVDEIVREEHQNQGAANITVQNIITSMRLISNLDWSEFFESVSLVDDLLKSGSQFSYMDFPTRNLYRTAIEELSRGSKLTELEVTHYALVAASNPPGPYSSFSGHLMDIGREQDPGYYLFAAGRKGFERKIKFKPPKAKKFARFVSRMGVGGYIAIVSLLTGFVLLFPIWALAEAQISFLRIIILTVLGIIPAIDASMAIVNRLVTEGINPTTLPSLDLIDGVPPRFRTLVAVPTLLTSPGAIEEQILQLEIHHLTCPDSDLYFALLSDYTDSDTEHKDGDDALLAIAIENIGLLNHRYGPVNGCNRFILLHRRRLWNEKQNQWMGWERKRGKLQCLNLWLRGKARTAFMALEGDIPIPPPDIRFVITLDSDTQMPLETPWRLIGKMAHPLNQPRFDPDTGRVVEGYALLQPRVAASLPMNHEGSIFQQIFSRSSGLDPYAAAVSDVYQDLFNEGSFAGKGIYDVDAFERALDNRVPENAMLSHDLFEGIFARAGLVSDIEVMEEFPSRYDVHAARQHRWARGDWQLFPWIFGFNPGHLESKNHLPQNRVPLIGIWKMMDNLRRTLSAPVSMLALLCGWTLPFDQAFAWTVFILSVIALPPFIPVFSGLMPRHGKITPGSYMRAFAMDFWVALSQTTLLITFLAHQAWLMSDAIGRSLFRLFISHRYLLEWVTAAQVKVSPNLSVWGFYRQMQGAVILGAIGVWLALWVKPENLLIVFPFVTIWLASPWIAFWVSLPPKRANALALSESGEVSLRLIARRTWRFFETFVTVEENFLPPDNFQEEPLPVVAHRTSPTNMGLYLLSSVTARDFGWSGTLEAVERLEATLKTMSDLGRFRGHFFNWYDTQTLRPLEPQYISSVDSGNLAGHLIALANACEEWAETLNALESTPEIFQGIYDNLLLTQEALKALPDNRRTQAIHAHDLESSLEILMDATQKAQSRFRLKEMNEKILSAHLQGLLPLSINMIDIARTLTSERGDRMSSEMLYWAEASKKSIEAHVEDRTRAQENLQGLKQRLAVLAETSRTMANGMAFGFLMNPNRKLLSIGYLVSEDRLDESCYDLLASEARLASFFAIAKGDIPNRHWFRLGRVVTTIHGGAALISWSGSMFEYLMPSLVMREPHGSLIDQTNHLVVARQIAYGNSLGVPWGISESAYNTRDLELTYQYSNFGVPGLGLKRGLRDNVVIAPYATALATMVAPIEACQNFQRLSALKALGRFGFYEALDYTRSRLPDGQEFAIIRAFMAHHQGMSIVAIADTLLNGLMRTRFHAEPMVQATELLLQERTPRDIAVAHPRSEEVSKVTKVGELSLPLVRSIHTPHTTTPMCHLLSNGRYSVMLTGAGSGYSQWNQTAITRWREDPTRDDWGSFIFLRDVQLGDIWSAGFQPSGVDANRYEVVFSEDRAEYMRRDGMIKTTMAVVVSSEDDAEVRRVSLTNLDKGVREIEITSYAELVLAPASADQSHPAFSKLFVETEYLPKVGAILATRRRRNSNEKEIWAAHLVVVEGDTIGEPEVETDRARFMGRYRDIRSPISVMDGRPLSNTVGTVLDPIFSMRRRVSIPPCGTVRIAFWTIVADSRRNVLDLVDKHHDANAFERAATLAWTQAQVQLHYLDIAPDEASLFQVLAGHILYVDPLMRPISDTIRRGSGPQSSLWVQSISGDHPIVLIRIEDIENIAIVRQLLKAHEYLRMKQVAFDLVILNERKASYIQDLQSGLETLVRTSQSRYSSGEGSLPRSVFVLRTDLISSETRDLLSSIARVVLDARRGTIAEQLNRVRIPKILSARSLKKIQPKETPTKLIDQPQLEFFNGLGGFASEGREYVTILNPGQSTPAPWMNVIANPTFGFQVAVEGSGYTWSQNSRENQLTPWSNDPVSDRPGEAFYIRDEDTGKFWSPTALPIRDDLGPYIATHGQGYSRFQHTAHDIDSSLLQFVPLEDSVKISRLSLKNLSDRPRRISITAYVEWVLGPSRTSSAPHIITDIDSETGCMMARNPWNASYAGQVGFMDMAGWQTDWTGDRQEFLGRNGSLDSPSGLSRKLPFSKRCGAGMDPCGVLQTNLTLKPHERVDIVLFLGVAPSIDEVRRIIRQYRNTHLETILESVHAFWDQMLGTLQVKTPDRGMDILLNRWLQYQTLACRVWARSAFYQSSGAYGFRDQLQDVMSLTLSKPAIAREHLLRAASRQFVEGDFQHWWLPSAGQGVRTLISDDKVWLAYATAHYIHVTGDDQVLEESVSFLEGQMLEPGEHDAFFLPRITDERASLFEHCALGLDKSLALGKHGLPLMGTGDWNDGMNRVGEGGSGESVWLGWFLFKTLCLFIPLAKKRKERSRETSWKKHHIKLQAALDLHGWDGAWFRRGYYDDGTPLGSLTSEECKIDAIAQSWSVLSGGASPEKAQQAMVSMEKYLILEKEQLALLFTPAFDNTILDPGYVKSYPPGIRENGGQYTHGACWSIMAFAALGQGNKAAHLFGLMNPIYHASTRAEAYRYKVEPYVMAADVYSVEPHVGRGGWTWYTGAAAWMYRSGIESILGFQIQGDNLVLNPCIPNDWPGFELTYYHHETRYNIVVENPHQVSQGVVSIVLDGTPLPPGSVMIPLKRDLAPHSLSIVLGVPNQEIDEGT